MDFKYVSYTPLKYEVKPGRVIVRIDGKTPVYFKIDSIDKNRLNIRELMWLYDIGEFTSTAHESTSTARINLTTLTRTHNKKYLIVANGVELKY